MIDKFFEKQGLILVIHHVGTKFHIIYRAQSFFTNTATAGYLSRSRIIVAVKKQ
jgi:hypothetical protein